MNHHPHDWLKLDNAAKIYPATSSRKSPAQFRLSVRMKENINYNAIYTAWKLMLERCPILHIGFQRYIFFNRLLERISKTCSGFENTKAGSIFYIFITCNSILPVYIQIELWT
jgi:hypothetical protein